MSWPEDLEQEVADIFGIQWNKRVGSVIPEAKDVALADGAVELDATFLYADLARSSEIAEICPWGTTAKLLRAYLDCSVRLIRAWGGDIRSFDGDRVMGIFIGDAKNSNATRCAQEIDWFVEKILRPKSKTTFTSVQKNNIEIRHCIGIDTGTARAVRAGIRSNNELTWIGKAPSFAAKLSDKRTFPYEIYISERCYKNLMSDAREIEGKDFWVVDTFTYLEKDEAVYKTRYIRTP